MMRRIYYFIVAVLIAGAFFGGYKLGHQKPAVEYIPDVKPPVNAIEHQPQTNQDYIDAFNSPLWHKGSYDSRTHIYTGFVSDNWKNITFYDKIVPTQPSQIGRAHV
jgi:hypothetical protein